jgi:hypothetical protein
MNRIGSCFAAALLVTLGVPGAACAQSPGKWDFTAAIYAYLPTIGGKTTFPPSGGASSVSVDAETILENLKMTFMGSLDASNGTWGVFTDLVYVDVGDAKSNTQDFSIGRVGLPAGTAANLDYDLKGWVWTLAGMYRVASTSSYKADVLAGARVLDLRQKVRWNLAGNVGPIALPDRGGTREVDEQNWDLVVGARGRAAFGDGKWFVPYYIDLGTGNSKFTWQMLAGVGYSFGWGDVVAAWRYIDYEMKSGKAVEDLNFNGPGIAAVFRW